MARADRRIVYALALVLSLGLSVGAGAAIAGWDSPGSGLEAFWSTVQGVWSSIWSSSDSRGVIDPNGVTDQETDSRGVIDPNGFTAGASTDSRGVIDPNGLAGDASTDSRGVIDPNGRSAP